MMIIYWLVFSLMPIRIFLSDIRQEASSFSQNFSKNMEHFIYRQYSVSIYLQSHPARLFTAPRRQKILPSYFAKLHGKMP